MRTAVPASGAGRPRALGAEGGAANAQSRSYTRGGSLKRECAFRGVRNGRCVYAEERPQFRTGIAAAETVGARVR